MGCNDSRSDPSGPDASAASGQSATHHRVLLIEDETLIRMNMADVLEGLGFEVLEAGSLNEARRLCDEHQVDTIISDMNLPDGTATQFLSEMRDRHPAIRLILATGGEAPEELLSRGAGTLTKPISDEALATALGT